MKTIAKGQPDTFNIITAKNNVIQRLNVTSNGRLPGGGEEKSALTTFTKTVRLQMTRNHTGMVTH
jgi:hypothetical protein